MNNAAGTGPGRRAAQRGVATLVVVMVLFFIVSMVAAYTNRNLIFEQRTSTNQFRSTQALEAAEAGVEWALALLNHQRIDAACENSTDPNDVNHTSFRQRYITTDGEGRLTPAARADGGVLAQACVFNGSTWNCSCPLASDNALPAPVQPGGNDVFPAFQLRFERIDPVGPGGAPTHPGVIRIHAVGCTRFDAACLAFGSPGITQEGRAALRVLVALTGNAVSPPTAAVLARQDIALSGTPVVANTDPKGTGITMHAGSGVSSAVLHTIAGTPPSTSVIANDPALALPTLPATAPATAITTADRMFAAVFNMRAATFRDQPAAVLLPCPGGTCDAQDVRDAVKVNPGRPLWLQGGLDVDSVDASNAIGSAAAPVLLVVNGGVDFSGAGSGSTIYGLVYSGTANWIINGTGAVRGAAVAEGRITGTGSPTFERDAAVLKTLRWSTGSFVRLSGGWKDFE